MNSSSKSPQVTLTHRLLGVRKKGTPPLHPPIQTNIQLRFTFHNTPRLQDLTPQNLNRYDALFVYANIERIDHQSEKNILDYVKSGHGYIPIHCASYCFLNSKPLTELTGARFKSHGTGTFKETYA